MSDLLGEEGMGEGMGSKNGLGRRKNYFTIWCFYIVLQRLPFHSIE